MAEVVKQEITDRYAIYNGDCIEVMRGLPSNSVDMTVYSPPFSELYNYSSDDRDLSNCKNWDEFLQHYGFVVEQITRLTKPGRLSCIHCMDFRGRDCWHDMPGDVIRIYESHGWKYHSAHIVWKEPLRVAIRTRAKGLMHKQIVKDSTHCYSAAPDKIIIMRKGGQNEIPVRHPHGITQYAGENKPPWELVAKYKGWEDPKTNKLAHWIWQRYASSVWMDIRAGRLLKYKSAKELEEEKHCCPLQLDVIERCMTLYSNPNDVVLTPFMGVGSEVWGAVMYGRKAIGIELKPSYFSQASRNIKEALEGFKVADEDSLFATAPDSAASDGMMDVDDELTTEDDEDIV